MTDKLVPVQIIELKQDWSVDDLYVAKSLEQVIDLFVAVPVLSSKLAVFAHLFDLRQRFGLHFHNYTGPMFLFVFVPE